MNIVPLDDPETLRWLLDKALNSYLDQNADSVVSAIKKDSPPANVLTILFEKESSGRKRKEVLDVLK